MAATLKDEALIPQILDLIRAGQTRTQIAVTLGWGPKGKSRVCGIIWRAGQRGFVIPKATKPPPQGRKKFRDKTAGDPQTAEALIQQGRSIREVAERLGIGRYAVSVIAKGVTVTGRPEEEQILDRRIADMLREGRPFDAIKERFGVGRNRIRRVIQEHNITSRQNRQVGGKVIVRKRAQVIPMIPSKAQIPMELFGPPAPPKPVVKVQPVYVGKPRQCEYLAGDEKPWVRCEHNIERGSYCKFHAMLCYSRSRARGRHEEAP